MVNWEYLTAVCDCDVNKNNNRNNKSAFDVRMIFVIIIRHSEIQKSVVCGNTDYAEHSIYIVISNAIPIVIHFTRTAKRQFYFGREVAKGLTFGGWLAMPYCSTFLLPLSAFSCRTSTLRDIHVQKNMEIRK